MKQGSRVEFVRRLAHFLGPRVLFGLLVTSIGSITLSVIELAIAMILQLFLQRIGILTQPVQLPRFLRGLPLSTASLTVSLIVIALVRGAGQFLNTQGAIQALETTNARLRRLTVYEMLLHPSRGSIASSLVNARVGETFPKAAWCCFFGAVMLGAMVQGALLATVLLAVAWREALVALVGVGIVGVITLRVNRGTRRAAARVPREQHALTTGIERVARNTMLVRALRTERREHVRFLESIDAYAKHSTRAATLSAAASALPGFLGIFLLLVLVGVSRQAFHTPGLILLSFLYLFIRFIQNLTVIAQAYSNANQFLPQLREALDYLLAFSRAEVDDAFAQPHPIEAGHALTTGAPAPPSIQITDLAYRYPGATRESLSGIDITFPGGEQSAIVGPSGCGKSTLLGVLLGLLPPTRGEIRIDGRSPGTFFADPQVRIGYVGAEPFLIAGSIRENLCYGLTRAIDDDAISKALENARLRSVVEGLPGGLDYQIPEDGSGLSAGQKQRLCLARALLNAPQLLVLDEVSANLDAATELEIAESLRVLRGECTTIIVSHRRGILRYTDKLLELQPPSSEA